MVGVVSAFPVSIFTVVSLSEDETAVTTGDASPENVYAPKNSSRPGVVNSMFSPFTFLILSAFPDGYASHGSITNMSPTFTGCSVVALFPCIFMEFVSIFLTLSLYSTLPLFLSLMPSLICLVLFNIFVA